MSQEQQLCLIHGHGVDASIWDDVYADLASEASVSRPDFARRTDLATIEAYADALYHYLQAITTQSVTLVGHSMGGYVALAFAEKYPKYVRALVLHHSTPKADDEHRRVVRAGAIDLIETQGSAAFIQRQLPKVVAPGYSPAKIQSLVERFQTLPADALVAGMRAIASRPDLTAILQQSTFPVLLLLGRQDQIIPYEQALQLSSLSNRIEVATVDHAGHLSMVEQPQQTSQLLREFLASL